MKKCLSVLLLLITVFVYGQTETEILYKEAEKICNQENNDFCKAYKYYKEQKYDSCYVYSAKALRNLDKNYKGKEVLNYIQGHSAIMKNLLKQAMTNLQEISDTSEYRNLKRFSLAYIHLKNRNFKEALDNLHKLEKEESRLSFKYRKLTIHNIAICYIHIKEYEKAEDYLKKEETIVKEKDTSDIIMSKMEFANIYYNQYLDDKAIPLFLESYELAKLYSDLRFKKNSAYNMAIVERNRKNFEKSLVYYQEFNKWKDSIWNRDKIWELTEKDKQVALAQKEKELLVKNEELKRQKLIKWFIVIIAIFCLGVLMLMFILKQRQVKYQNYISSINKTNEERERISKELHDGILGKLFGIRFGLGYLQIEGNNKIIEKYQYFLDELKEIEEEIRDVSHKLNTPLAKQDNFSALIKKLLEEKSKIAKFEYELNIPDFGKLEEIEESLKVNIYRILQEAIHNIVKHAEATQVSVTISLEESTLYMKIEDNGAGFIYNNEQYNKGIGIKNIVSRVDAIKGKLNIQTGINKGTILTFYIPFKKIS
ncbi:tetratricopeptide repeat-containing sensor histidine kinase [Tenacibaculum sp. TC6]|uniref:tetratricopeptide repeat-containing sensor histidine kinase n=1 Tax=Tenacibaculum sp. TC6 TaxID=3423223 RepID=UPI003D35D8CA